MHLYSSPGLDVTINEYNDLTFSTGVRCYGVLERYEAEELEAALGAWLDELDRKEAEFAERLSRLNPEPHGGT